MDFLLLKLTEVTSTQESVYDENLTLVLVMLFSSLYRDFQVVDHIKYVTYLLSLTESLTLYLQCSSFSFLSINPNPPCQLSLWEETGEPG